MAKRFTDTEKWKDEWYISLSNDYKIVWQWLLDNCSHAGICKPSLNILNRDCQTNMSKEDFNLTFGSRVLDNGNVWFIPKFIQFQYSTLHSKKPAIVSVVKEINKYNLNEMIPLSFGNDYLIIKDKDKDKDMVMDTVTTPYENNNNGEDVFSPAMAKYGTIDPQTFFERYKSEKQYSASIDTLGVVHHTTRENILLWLEKFRTQMIIQAVSKTMSEFVHYFGNWMNKNYDPDINPTQTNNPNTKKMVY